MGKGPGRGRKLVAAAHPTFDFLKDVECVAAAADLPPSVAKKATPRRRKCATATPLQPCVCAALTRYGVCCQLFRMALFLNFELLLYLS